MVESALDDRADHLKERSIGTELFGRQPDYDTNADHMVRTVAGEVRKRLAQYYVEPGREDEIRIDLPAGSYLPQFRRTVAGERKAANGIVPDSEETATLNLEPRRTLTAVRPSGSLRVVLPIAGACLIIAAGIVWTRARLVSETMTDQFWAPVTASSNTVTLCVGQAESTNSQEAQPLPTSSLTLSEAHRRYEKVAFADAVTLAQLSGLLKTRGRNFRVLYSPQITLADMRQGPTILIGAFDNDWTLRLTGPLRYSFQWDATFNVSKIVDGQHPEFQDWTIDWRTPYLQLSEDYAIVSRVADPTTGEILIVVAGITKYGTLAAGEFLTSSRMDELKRYAPRGWEHKNLQVVLSTKVVKGSPGPPRVVTAYFW